MKIRIQQMQIMLGMQKPQQHYETDTENEMVKKNSLDSTKRQKK